MSDQHFGQQAEAGELVTALADERCRAVVSFFREFSGDSASLETLACVLHDRVGESQRQFAVGLHHVSLPALAAAGVVTYDADDRVVEFLGHPELDRLEELVLAG